LKRQEVCSPKWNTDETSPDLIGGRQIGEERRLYSVALHVKAAAMKLA
jgi:hypothetical protein